MDLATTTIIISIGLALIIIGYVFNRIKNFLFLPMAGGVLLTLLAITMFSNPIQYVTGETLNATVTAANETITNVQYQYTNLNDNSNTILSWVLLLTGFINIIISGLFIYNRRFEDETTYNW